MERDIAMPSQLSQAVRPATSWTFGRPTVWPMSTRRILVQTASVMLPAVVSTLMLAEQRTFTVVVRDIKWTAPKDSLSSLDSSPSTERTTATSRRFSASTSRTAALSNSRHSMVLTACLTVTAKPMASLMVKEASPTACRKE